MYRFILLFTFACFLSACGNTRRDEDLPVVNVNYFRMLPSAGLSPNFEIGLKIINPANRPLNLVGISYSIKLEGHRILVGVSNDLPVIEPYSEDVVVIKASADMIGSFLLVSKLIKEKNESINYEFSAKLDTANLRRDINIVREGTLSLSGGAD